MHEAKGNLREQLRTDLAVGEAVSARPKLAPCHRIPQRPPTAKLLCRCDVRYTRAPPMNSNLLTHTKSSIKVWANRCCPSSMCSPLASATPVLWQGLDNCHTDP